MMGLTEEMQAQIKALMERVEYLEDKTGHKMPEPVDMVAVEAEAKRIFFEDGRIYTIKYVRDTMNWGLRETMTFLSRVMPVEFPLPCN